MNWQHIGLEVGDLFVMERFYRQVMGFGLEYRYVSRNSPGLRTVFLHRGSVQLELLHHRSAAGDTDQPRTPTNWGHVSLDCDNLDRTWEEMRERAVAAGCPTAAWRPPRQTGDGFREAVIIDPEGNTIELGARVLANPRPPIQAVIFDFDGTLADSEPNYCLAARQLLAEYGHEYSDEDNERHIGLSNQATLEAFITHYRLPVPFAELARRKDEIYLGLAIGGTRAFPAMLRFLDLVAGNGLPVAVASGSSRAVLLPVLESLGLGRRFPVVISSEEVARGKPAPDVFLEAARRLGQDPQCCLVVEDSRPGVEAAIRAFMPCLAIPSQAGGPLDASFLMADCLVSGGMPAFNPEAAFDWLRRFPAS